MPSVFSRAHTWGPTDVVYGADLNAEFNNILNNLDPSGVGSWSQTLTQMRSTTAPSESNLAASLSAEIQELRYQLLVLAGAGSTYWYSQPATDLTQLKNAIGGSLANNRLISGTASTLSSRSRLLLPSGSTASVTLKATTVPFSYAVNGTIYNISADVVVGGLATASGTNNTMIINDTTLSGQQRSTWAGEDGSVLNVTSMGTGIQSLIGSIAGFQTAQNEYMLGYVASSTQIQNCFRGFFLNSSGTGVTRSTVSNGDSFTLLKLAWFFATTAGSVAVSYTNPKFQYSTPSGTSGDYWYDITNQTWKTFGSSWGTAAATLVGCALITTSAAVAARSFDYYSNVDSYNSIALQWNTTSQVVAALEDAAVSVGPNLVRFQYSKPNWDFTANLESGAVSASTTYWLYVSPNGQTVLSPNKPHDFNGTLKGYYHPFEMYRAVGSVATNASTAFDTNSISPLVFHPDSQLNLDSPRHLLNAAIASSVSASAMVVSLTRKNGQNADPINYIQTSFGTASVGTYAARYITSGLSITVPVGASLGQVSGVNQYVWVYLIDNNGTVDIAVAGDYVAPSGVNFTATQIGASSTVSTTLYSNNAYSGKPVRLVGRLLVNESTAGQWTSAPSETVLDPQPKEAFTDPVAYTPTFTSFGVCSTVTVTSWRRGKLLCSSGIFTGGTPVSSGGWWTIGYQGANAPSINIDTAAMGPLNRIIGTFAAATASGVNSVSGAMLYLGGNTGVVGPGFAFANANPSLNNANISSLLSTNVNQPFSFFYEVPILGWSTWGPI